VSEPTNTAPHHRFSRKAMGTRFEIVLACAHAGLARQLASDAFRELEGLERELSRFIASSDVARINRLPAGGSVRIGAAAYDCLKIAARVHAETRGAFDPTVGALLATWQDRDGSPRTPSDDELAEARRRSGMHLVEIHKGENAVTARAEGVIVDLGGIGKGYALDAMAELLAEWGVESALLHGGESTVLGLGSGPENGWTVALRAPGTDDRALEGLCLRGRALSGSGVELHGRHIIEPHTGRPVERYRSAWALADGAARADALSTAFMVMDEREIESYCAAHEDCAAAVIRAADGESVLRRFGRWEGQ